MLIARIKQGITVMVFCLFSILGISQEFNEIVFDTTEFVDTISRIEMLAKYDGSSIMLRWAPNNPSAWYLATKGGYKIERFEISEETGLPNTSLRDTIIVTPWLKEDFRPFNNTSEESKFILTMGECIHGELSSSSIEGFVGTSTELKNKYGFALLSADMDFKAAIAGGIGYRDDNVEEGKTYFYRISSLNLNLGIESGYETQKAEFQPTPIPFIHNGIEGESKVTIQWSRDDHEPHFSGYWIEKSKDGETFERFGDVPFIGGESREFPSSVFSFTDRVENYDPYWYRIIGVSPFGELSPPSEKVQLKGRDRTPCPQPKDLSIMTDPNTKTVLLKWKSDPCDDLKGFQVLKGNNSDEEFEVISPIIDRNDVLEFKEVVNSIHGKIYYQIMALDTAGNRSITLPRLAAFRDTIPPAIPAGITGEIDSNGVVTLQWNTNSEEDFRGYHVYRANADYHMFTMINPIPIEQPLFKDTITLKTFTEEIFYKITSVDYQGHISKFSEPVRIVKPDTVRPFPPSILNYGQEDEYLYFDWTPSRSEDIIGHKFYKKINNENWYEMADIGNEGRYQDFETTPGNLYSYKIIAIDDAGNESVDHATVRIKYVDKSLPEIIEITYCAYQDSAHVELRWDAVTDAKTKYVTLYKSMNGGPLTVLDRVKDETSFIDNRIKKDRVYSYALKQVWIDGKKSDFSKTVSPKRE